MNLRKAIAGLAGAAALMGASVAPSMAQQQTFASVTGTGLGGQTASTVFTFGGGAGGAFSTNAGSVFNASFLPTGVVNQATFTLTGLNVTTAATGAGTSADPFGESLLGGSFLITQNGTGTVLLSGMVGLGNTLSAVNGASTAGITANLSNVTFTGGTYFAMSGLQNPGSLSFSLTSVNPTISLTGGFINGFTAGGTGTFSASPGRPNVVPEPSTYATFGLAGFGLLGLMVRARKTRRMTA